MKCLRVGLFLFGVGCLHAFILSSSYTVHLSPLWYPGKKSDLLMALSKYDQQAQELYGAQLQGSLIRALIVPHAGYDYSGVIASAAYRLLVPNFFKRVIILGPSHYEFFKGVGLPDKNYTDYKNILGHIALDTQVLKALALSTDVCSYHSHAHAVDHCINVQLPFVQQYCGKQCLLVPLLIGEVTEQEVEKIALLLRPYIDEKTLVIISSDLTHYGKRFLYEPFKSQENITQQIYDLDSAIVQKIQKGDLHEFDSVLHQTGATVCGKNPLEILLALEQQKAFGNVATYVVGYDTSASAEKAPAHSVSYASCVISNELLSDMSHQNRLTGYEKQMLLAIAHQRLEDVVENKPAKNVAVPGLCTNALSEIGGAFVTLYKIGRDGYKQLRGCIGTTVGAKPLYQTVYEMAASSALHDHRFSPVTKDELPYIDLAVSVLTEPKAIGSYHEIKLGRDGVILQQNERSAVYLPHVAVEQGLSLEEMLESLSKKAGLPKDGWKDDNTHYQVFQSIDFAQDKDPLEFMYEGY